MHSSHQTLVQFSILNIALLPSLHRVSTLPAVLLRVSTVAADLQRNSWSISGPVQPFCSTCLPYAGGPADSCSPCPVVSPANSSFRFLLPVSSWWSVRLLSLLLSSVAIQQQLPATGLVVDLAAELQQTSHSAELQQNLTLLSCC